jgi:hypothetical protein
VARQPRVASCAGISATLPHLLAFDFRGPSRQEPSGDFGLSWSRADVQREVTAPSARVGVVVRVHELSRRAGAKSQRQIRGTKATGLAPSWTSDAPSGSYGSTCCTCARAGGLEHLQQLSLISYLNLVFEDSLKKIGRKKRVLLQQSPYFSPKVDLKK